MFHVSVPFLCGAFLGLLSGAARGLGAMPFLVFWCYWQRVLLSKGQI